MPLFLFFFIRALKLKVNYYEVITAFFLFALLFLYKGALCRVSGTSQTSSTGLPHVETLTSPPRTKKLGRDRWEEGKKKGVRARGVENECVSVREREIERAFLLISITLLQPK